MDDNNENAVGGKVEYLQMIQENIGRMSTSSAIFKGFTATIVAGVSALSFAEVNKWVLLLSFIPILCFTYLDTYYLQLERRFRFLYEQVRLCNHSIDFDLEPPKVESIPDSGSKKKARLWSCFWSKSVWCFYLPMLIISIIVVVLEFRGCLG